MLPQLEPSSTNWKYFISQIKADILLRSPYYIKCNARCGRVGADGAQIGNCGQPKLKHRYCLNKIEDDKGNETHQYKKPPSITISNTR
jgi:hypothetical protein